MKAKKLKNPLSARDRCVGYRGGRCIRCVMCSSNSGVRLGRRGGIRLGRRGGIRLGRRGGVRLGGRGGRHLGSLITIAVIALAIISAIVNDDIARTARRREVSLGLVGLIVKFNNYDPII
jgi:hypothetical protein